VEFTNRSEIVIRAHKKENGVHSLIYTLRFYDKGFVVRGSSSLYFVNFRLLGVSERNVFR
jgi:hypothetical protein